MTAGDGDFTVPGKSPAVMPSLRSKDGTDGLDAVPSVLGKSRTANCPRLSDGTVDITARKHAHASMHNQLYITS
jgi:hypothetical protein